MNIDPIDIQIEDKRRYGLIAFLVDRDEFLRGLKKAREKLNITEIPSKLLNPVNPPKEQGYEILEHHKKGVITLSEVWALLHDVILKSETKLKMQLLTKLLDPAMEIAGKLAKKYNKGAPYRTAIFNAILTGKIHSYDFRATQAIYLTTKQAKELLGVKDPHVVAITINPESTWDELKDTFKFANEFYFAKPPTKSLKKKSRKKTNLRLIDADTISNIKRDRKWYWQRKNGLGPSKIHRQALEEKIFISESGVIKAIEQYEKRLRAET